MTSLVKLEDIFVTYGVGKNAYLQASYNVNLEINAGDMIAVIGESGCGKSTIGKLVLGTVNPSKGKVSFLDKNIWSDTFKWTHDLRAMVQIIHQDPFSSLNPVRTIYQTLAAPLLYYKIAKNKKDARERVKELLQSVGLAPAEFFINKFPFQLSGGQKQRASIARATILKPRLIIADEPVSAVDASLRLSILDLMKELNIKNNIAFLYITHDLATARYFAPDGKLIVMYLGRMVETGIINECVSNPVHPYLQALLKAIPPSDPKKAREPIEIPLKSFEMPSPINPPSGCVFNPRCLYADSLCEKEVP
ncbi:MAG: ABC transporter ATP-binding protein, partial [Candidatus Sericytochromatia bacterium]|nr:ABC transporter ATP-binding protein [Candidatus Sericytochromatia bacterium]